MIRTAVSMVLFREEDEDDTDEDPLTRGDRSIYYCPEHFTDYHIFFRDRTKELLQEIDAMKRQAVKEQERLTNLYRVKQADLEKMGETIVERGEGAAEAGPSGVGAISPAFPAIFPRISAVSPADGTNSLKISASR